MNPKEVRIPKEGVVFLNNTQEKVRSASWAQGKEEPKKKNPPKKGIKARLRTTCNVIDTFRYQTENNSLNKAPQNQNPPPVLTVKYFKALFFIKIVITIFVDI